VHNQEEVTLSRVLAGAAIGAGFAFLFMTRSGKKLLNSADPWLDEVIRDMQRLRATAAKVRDAVEEGRKSFESISKMGSFGDKGGNSVQQTPWASDAKH
jgi:gas vesicle protein